MPCFIASFGVMPYCAVFHIILHGAVLYVTISYYSTSYHTTMLYYVIPQHIEFDYSMLYCIYIAVTKHHIMLRNHISYHTRFNRIILDDSITSHVVLCCAALCYIILYCIMPCSIVSYYIKLHHPTLCAAI